MCAQTEIFSGIDGELAYGDAMTAQRTAAATGVIWAWIAACTGLWRLPARAWRRRARKYDQAADNYAAAGLDVAARHMREAAADLRGHATAIGNLRR